MIWYHPTVRGQAPSKRSAHRLICVNDQLYLFGGGVWTPSPDPAWVFKYNDIYSYDMAACCWTKLKVAGNIGVCTFAMPFVLDNFIFVFGGQSTSTHFCTNDLYCLDTVTQSWMKINCEGNLPKQRDVGTATVVHDKVVLFGGSSGTPIDDVNILHPNLFSFSSVSAE